MTRKKTHTKDTALLDALRSNLNLLGELAVRYAVEFHPEPPRRTYPLSPAPKTCAGCWGRIWPRSPRSNSECCS